VKWSRIILLLIAVFWLVFYLLIRNDPFFGDAISSVSRAALLIFDSNFSTIKYPDGYDPGHPVLIPLLYALFWKVFGMSLPISHLLNMLFSIGIMAIVWNWAKEFMNREVGILAILLLSATPLFLAQSAMMNTHLPLAFFFIWAAFELKKERYITFGIVTSFMMLVHLQAVFYLVVLLIWSLILLSNLSIRGLIKTGIRFLPAVLIFALWVFYHYSISGWALSSPDYAAHRGSPGPKGILINLILSDWRIVDYGQIALFIFPMIALFGVGKSFGRKSVFTWFLIAYLFNALLISVTTTTGPAHRYFLPCLPLLVLACAEELKEKVTWKHLLVFGLLLSGNFWFYPGKIVGDATLQYRSTFSLLEEIFEEVGDSEIHSFAPLGNISRSMYLNDNTGTLSSLYGQNFGEQVYILYGNVSGDFSTDELEYLAKNWYGNSYESGRIWLNLYSNPLMVEKNEKWKLREKSKGEIWMENLKKRIRSN